MHTPDHSSLIADLSEEYTRFSPVSAALNERASVPLVDGGSHAIRLMEPFPPRIVSARGARLTDEDGHGILDFWQGHYANVLGHNPEVITSELARAFQERNGLQTGFTDRVQTEVAELLCRQTGADKVRFTTSGTLATMYAILLARAFTGRDLVMKMGGGWHGAHPWGLKGISLRFDGDRPSTGVDSAGLPREVTDDIIVTGFNDLERLHDDFRRYGDRTACLIVEPLIGSGGFIMATREYLKAARELTREHGAILILDEVISGFRFRAGDLGRLRGIEPDLTAYGKVIGGGMPVAAVAGRADLMNQVGREGGSTVKFGGGTYSAHPASMLAARAMLSYLVAHEDDLYPRLFELGALAQETVEAAFAQEGICARCTGPALDDTQLSSLLMIHFPHRADQRLERPEDLFDPGKCDVELAGRVLPMALLLENVHVMRSRLGLSAAHTVADVALLGEACERVARRVRDSVGGAR
jgi:glutamate-1-semialdehyde 2,1-aminomutase